MAALNVGVSLYSWTGVIGGTLAGLALGSAWGALVASHGGEDANRRRILALMGLAAVWAPIAVTALTMPGVVVGLAGLGRLGQLAVVLLLTALLPAALLGATGPLLARLALRRLDEGGRVVGGLGAANTVGSLVGGLAAGLLLVPALGVRGTAIGVAGALVAVALGPESARSAGAALSIGARGGGTARPRPRRRVVAQLAALGAATTMAWAAPHTCDAESAYQCLRVEVDTTPEGDPIRVLYLDGLPHAHVSLDDPLLLAHDYLVPAAELVSYGTGRRVLVIGGGGHSLPRHIAAAHIGATIDVLELDPVVTATARLRLGLAVDPPFAIHHGDARQTLAALPTDRRYDLAVLDAFADVVVPYHLVTAELDAMVRARLTPQGRYVALVHDRADVGRLLPAVARTMRHVFGAVDILAAGPGVRWDRPVSRTWSVVGGATPLDADRVRHLERHTARGAFPPLSERMPVEQLAALLGRPGPALLTDNYAPVEVLAAPLFR